MGDRADAVGGCLADGETVFAEHERPGVVARRLYDVRGCGKHLGGRGRRRVADEVWPA
ncbi:hypothetical protein [Streptomyces sp. NPDC054849]